VSVKFSFHQQSRAKKRRKRDRSWGGRREDCLVIRDKSIHTEIASRLMRFEASKNNDV
jgi:hypothetical protein